MGAWAYCTNEDCQRGFDKPSFAEIAARKRECPACGHINRVGDDLGTALDEKFAEIAELLTAGSQPVAVADDKPEKPRDTTLKVAGKPFRCSCGCNVFQKRDPTNPNEYTCNACEATYEGN